MSLYGFQSAVATLIRRPPVNRGDSLDALFAEFNLTVTERRKLHQMALIEELNKYAMELCDRRWISIEKHLLRIPKYIDIDLLHDLWLMQYEPSAMRIAGDIGGASSFSLEFLRFLQKSPQAREAISQENPPDFIWDLLAYEEAEIEVTALTHPGPSLAADAVVQNNRFRVLHLMHDMADLVGLPTQSREGGDELPQVAVRETWYVLVGSKASNFPRLFEVDEFFALALESQLQEHPPRWPDSLDVGMLRRMSL